MLEAKVFNRKYFEPANFPTEKLFTDLYSNNLNYSQKQANTTNLIMHYRVVGDCRMRQ